MRKKQKRISVKVKRHDFPWKKWGNSVLAFNYKIWTCIYCGLPLKSGTPFEMAMINGNPLPYIFCSPTCEKAQLVKLDMLHYEN